MSDETSVMIKGLANSVRETLNIPTEIDRELMCPSGFYLIYQNSEYVCVNYVKMHYN